MRSYAAVVKKGTLEVEAGTLAQGSWPTRAVAGESMDATQLEGKGRPAGIEEDAQIACAHAIARSLRVCVPRTFRQSAAAREVPWKTLHVIPLRELHALRRRWCEKLEWWVQLQRRHAKLVSLQAATLRVESEHRQSLAHSLAKFEHLWWRLQQCCTAPAHDFPVLQDESLFACERRTSVRFNAEESTLARSGLVAPSSDKSAEPAHDHPEHKARHAPAMKAHLFPAGVAAPMPLLPAGLGTAIVIPIELEAKDVLHLAGFSPELQRTEDGPKIRTATPTTTVTTPPILECALPRDRVPVAAVPRYATPRVCDAPEYVRWLTWIESHIRLMSEARARSYWTRELRACMKPRASSDAPEARGSLHMQTLVRAQARDVRLCKQEAWQLGQELLHAASVTFLEPSLEIKCTSAPNRSNRLENRARVDVVHFPPDFASGVSSSTRDDRHKHADTLPAGNAMQDRGLRARRDIRIQLVRCAVSFRDPAHASTTAPSAGCGIRAVLDFVEGSQSCTSISATLRAETFQSHGRRWREA